MIGILTFSIIAAGLVFLAGRRDAARDPRLTLLLLILSAVFPLLALMLPKIELLPAGGSVAGEAGFPIGKLLWMIWAAGFGIAAARLGCAALSLRRWRNRSREIGRVSGVSIRELAGLRGPVAAGVRRPVIFVPDSWATWPEVHRRVALGHELAHHRRRDPLWRLLAETALAIHWYHPLVRWMVKRFVMQCEFACDAMVVGNGVDAKIYARVLCDCAEERPLSPLALAMAEPSSLHARVSRMLEPRGRSDGGILLALSGIGLTSAIALAMIGGETGVEATPSAQEVHLRLTADPFPGGR